MISTEILIIGGGATGLGVAWDAALRGYKSILVEKGDVAHGTSGRYHGLLHSGARYVVRDPRSALDCYKENLLLKKLLPSAIEDSGGFFVALDEDPAEYVGRRLEFRITKHEEDRRGTNVVLSRRALLEEEAQVRAVETRGKLVVGAVLPGVVTALKDFGAFVDVGGIEGLLPASEISFERGTRPGDVLTVGQPVTVQVMRVEKRDDPRRPEQVSFSLKALERDPWQDAVAQFPAGTFVRGQVTRAEPFGAFVQLAPGVEGLVHISVLAGEGASSRPLRHARDAVKPGDAIEVVVLAVEADKRRISLGLATHEERVDDEGRAAAARASGRGSGMGTLGDLLKGKLPGR